MAFIDKEAARKFPEKCPTRIGSGWDRNTCGKPVKETFPIGDNGAEVGLCGLHAGAHKRTLRNDEVRRQQWEEQSKQRALDRQRMERLRELGVRYWDHAEVLRVLEEMQRENIRLENIIKDREAELAEAQI